MSPKSSTASSPLPFSPLLIQQGVALLSGAVNFFVLKAMVHLLPNAELYSQFSSVFLVFAFYLTFIDLGSQTEYLRIYQKNGGHHLPSLRVIGQMRGLFALAALGIALLQAAIAELSTETTLSLLLYVGSLLPLSIVAMWDTYWYASAHMNRAIAVRLCRILGSIAFVLPFLFSPAPGIWPAYVIFWFICALAALALLGQKEFREALQLKSWLTFSWQPDLVRIWKSALKTGSIVAVSSLAWLTFQGLALRMVGESHFSYINTTIALSTPFTLYFQTYLAVNLRELSHWAVAERPHYLARIRRPLAHLGLAGLASCGAVFICEELGILRLLFGEVTPPLSRYWLAYILSQCIAQLSGCFSVFAVFSEEQLWLSKVFGLSIPLGLPLLYLCIDAWGDLGFFYFQCLYWLGILFLATLYVRGRLRVA